MRFRRRTRDTEVELNITAFLNLMVVLIPFLLLNAVFAQVAILQLNLPADDAAPSEQQQDEKKLVLEVLIYQDRYEVADRNSGPLAIIENTDDGSHNQAELHDKLKEIKEAFPDINNITLLCEDETPYELLIQTMDTVRLQQITINGQQQTRELFPEIGIGSAPPDQRRAGQAEGGAG